MLNSTPPESKVHSPTYRDPQEEEPEHHGHARGQSFWKLKGDTWVQWNPADVVAKTIVTASSSSARSIPKTLHIPLELPASDLRFLEKELQESLLGEAERHRMHSLEHNSLAVSMTSRPTQNQAHCDEMGMEDLETIRRLFHLAWFHLGATFREATKARHASPTVDSTVLLHGQPTEETTTTATVNAIVNATDFTNADTSTQLTDVTSDVTHFSSLVYSSNESIASIPCPVHVPSLLDNENFNTAMMQEYGELSNWADGVLYVKGRTLFPDPSDAVSTNKDAVSTNKDAVSTNKDAVSTNKDAVSTNSLSLDYSSSSDPYSEYGSDYESDVSSYPPNHHRLGSYIPTITSRQGDACHGPLECEDPLTFFVLDNRKASEMVLIDGALPSFRSIPLGEEYLADTGNRTLVSDDELSNESYDATFALSPSHSNSLSLSTVTSPRHPSVYSSRECYESTYRSPRLITWRLGSKDTDQSYLFQEVDIVRAELMTRSSRRSSTSLGGANLESGAVPMFGSSGDDLLLSMSSDDECIEATQKWQSTLGLPHECLDRDKRSMTSLLTASSSLEDESDSATGSECPATDSVDISNSVTMIPVKSSKPKPTSTREVDIEGECRERDQPVQDASNNATRSPVVDTATDGSHRVLHCLTCQEHSTADKRLSKDATR